MNNILIIVLIFGLLTGAVGANKISNLNPFKSSPKVVEKSEGYKTEIFKDHIKGVEYKIEEKYKNQQPSKSNGTTIGGKIGNFIDSSLQMIVFFLIGGILLLFFTGINVFKFVKTRLTQLNQYRKALKQTVRGVQEGKRELNGEKEKFLKTLETKMDDDVKKLIKDIKYEEGIK